MLRTIYISSLLLFSLSGVFSQEKINWMTIQDAIAAHENSNSPKKFIITIYTDKCGWCRKMDKHTFSQEFLAKTINEKFYPVKFHADTKETVIFKGREFKYLKGLKSGYHELVQYLLKEDIKYPSVVFLDEEYNVLQTIAGFQYADDFEKMVEFYGDDHYKVMSWRRFIKKSCTGAPKSYAIPVGNNY